MREPKSATMTTIQETHTGGNQLRDHLKKIELLLDNASNQLRQDNNSQQQQQIFTTVSSGLTTTNNNNNFDQAEQQKQRQKDRDATLEDIDTLKNVLACPIFNRLIDVQDSLDKLTHELQLHPSISLADFDIDENSGELILAPPIEATTLSQSDAVQYIHQQPTAIYNGQSMSMNNFNHQTEILFNDSNIQNHHHLTFNSSQFDVQQHVLHSLKQHQHQHYIIHDSDSHGSSTDDQILLKQATKLRNRAPDLISAVDSQAQDTNCTSYDVQDKAALYSTVAHGGGNNSTSSNLVDLVNIDQESAQQHQVSTGRGSITKKKQSNDGAGDKSSYATVDKSNKRQQKNPGNLQNSALVLNQPQSSMNFETNVVPEVYQHQQTTNISPHSCNNPVRGTNHSTPATTTRNPEQSKNFDSYSSTNMGTPVSEKLLDIDINLVGRTSCSPSTSIGSTVKLVDEGYSGASSLQSNVEKANINGSTPSPQSRICGSINNNNVQASSSASVIRDSPLEDLNFAQTDSPLEPSNLHTVSAKDKKKNTDARGGTLSSFTNDLASPEMERLTVTLEKNDKGLGITVAGFVCKQEGLAGIFIKEIASNSPASLNGNIRELDQIYAVDGKPLTGYSNQQAVEVLKQAGKTLELELLRYIQGAKYQSLRKALLMASPSPSQIPKTAQRVSAAANQKSTNPNNSNPITESSPDASTGRKITSDLHENQVIPSSSIQPKSTQQRPIPAPKPASIIPQSNHSQMIESNQPLESKPLLAGNRQQQISSALQPTLQRASTISGDGGETNLPSGSPRLSSSQKIIESISGSRNKVNILAKTNPVNTRTEVTIDVKDSMPQIQNQKQEVFGSVRQYSIPMTAQTAKQSNASASQLRISETSNDGGSSDKNFQNENDINFTNATSSTKRIVEDQRNSTIYKTDTLRCKFIAECRPVWDEKSKATIVKLYKDDQKGLGFSVKDYENPTDSKQTIIIVTNLVPGGIAHRDGGLDRGDRLLFVDDVDLRNATLEEAVKALKKANGWVSLGVLKPKQFYSSTTDETKLNTYN